MKAMIMALCLIFPCVETWAQNGYKGGIMFQFKPDFSLGKDWKLNTKLESRQLLFEGLNKDPFHSMFQYERSDLEMVVSKKISPSSAVGGGYLIRLDEGEFIHRLIQQFSITQKAFGMRIGHRFRTDETFEKNDPNRYRLRYRISMEKPLNGQEIDPGELYLNVNNEYLQTVQDQAYSLEIRAMGALGFNFSDRSKLETGLEYRIEDLFLNSNTQLFWLNMAWYVSF